MEEVVGIIFKENGKIYYFLPGKYILKKGTTVIVKTEQGLQFGKVEIESFKLDLNKLKSPLNKVVRIASKDDYMNNKKNIDDAREALIKSKELVQKYNLNMFIIDANYTFDRSQLVFRFISNDRIDFRKLAKDLASIYKTRIELRQVGVRDKAREVGGCGICGRPLCCAGFLKDFESVSINMAKNQGLALNPDKINGVCDRLLCCLKYENDTYGECRKCLPQTGKKVKTNQGEGKVISVNVLKGTYRVDIPEKGIVEFNKDESN